MSRVGEMVAPAGLGEIGSEVVSPLVWRHCADAADVALSIAALDEIPLTPALELLNRAELERAERISCNDYRQQVVKARALLRLMLARLTGASPESFEFDEGVGRQPRLRVNPWGLHFSVSHSGEKIAVAVSTAPIGIDIECVEVDCDWSGIAETCFHQSERQALCDVEGAAARETFFDIWTRKEAYLKAIGTALETDPPSFSTVAADGIVRTGASDSDFRADTWHTRAIDAPAGYKAALVSRWPNPRLVHCAIDGATAPRCPASASPRQRHEARVCADPVLGWASAR